ncbi:MAG: hypothetical protein KF754_16270 [Planctomycetes bacterium]|nr:hypothetical protein [Planctomycetota bacterium]
MSPEPKKPANSPDDDKTITEVGRELLKYLHRRASELGVNQASYRQARMELLRSLEGEAGGKFNWGFETVFTQEIHVLEDLGLISVKYGSGAIMAGKGKPNQIYNVSLTDDGKDTARIIVDREERIRTETAKLDKSDKAGHAEVEDDEDEGDDTDKSVETSTKAAPAEAKPNEADAPTQPPTGLPGDKFAKE